MNQLYIEIELKTTKHRDTEIFTSIPSFVALYVYNYLNNPGGIKLNFVCSTLPSEIGKIKLRSESLVRELTEDKILCKDGSQLEAVRDLRLPIFEKDGDTFIAGMCSVCRELITCSIDAAKRKLLGFKESCLLAPSECSIWTRFCEVNVIQSLSQLLTTIEKHEAYTEMPVECARFESHMNEPVRMHNIYKLAREQANQEANSVGEAIKKGRSKIKIECSVPREKLAIEHKFAEGITFTIADLILYPCMRLIYQCFPKMLIKFPLTNTWLNEIDLCEGKCQQIFNDLCVFPCVDYLASGVEFKIPDCDAISLYKSDPKRYKPRNRIFTEQTEVEATLNKLHSLKINFSSQSSLSYYCQSHIDWQTIEPTHAESSALPKSRLLRKRQQLENLVNAVASLAYKGQRIVDFCSGTGHLGILLALKLQQCTIILMENKSISLQKAKARAKELNLKNVRFYQCNIDYFDGDFDVGTSLHACGTATDIVLQQCQKAKANFVCCPCCYGSVQPMPHVKYPLSNQFRQVLSEKEFLYIAHTADQSHALGTLNCKPETTLQGQLCMDIVDTDRKLQAEEAGYKVLLTRLQPESCTPKNRLLVGHLVQDSR